MSTSEPSSSWIPFFGSHPLRFPGLSHSESEATYRTANEPTRCEHCVMHETHHYPNTVAVDGRPSKITHTRDYLCPLYYANDYYGTRSDSELHAGDRIFCCLIGHHRGSTSDTESCGCFLGSLYCTCASGTHAGCQTFALGAIGVTCLRTMFSCFLIGNDCGIKNFSH